MLVLKSHMKTQNTRGKGIQPLLLTICQFVLEDG